MPALNVLSSMHTTLFGGTIVLKLQNMPRPNAQRNPRRCSGPVPTAVGSIAKGVVALQKVGRKGSMKVSQVTAPLANQILEALSAARVRMSLSPNRSRSRLRRSSLKVRQVCLGIAFWYAPQKRHGMKLVPFPLRLTSEPLLRHRCKHHSCRHPNKFNATIRTANKEYENGLVMDHQKDKKCT